MNKINFKIIAILILSVIFNMMIRESGFAKDICPNLEAIYIRGTGGERYNTDEWRSLTQALEQKMTKAGLSYQVQDLDYPASGADNAIELAGIAFSGGKAGEFGRSVDVGVVRLKEYQIERLRRCPDLKFLIVGYSQGAKVIAQALTVLEKSSVIYLAFLGDPNLHLPEGIGAQRSLACLGGALSAYRVYAPDCKTSAGLLGARNPYEPGGWEGKVGLWCNAEDLICGSSKNLLANSGHALYDDLGHFNKVVDIFIEKIQNSGIVVGADLGQIQKSNHMDTVFLLDTTGSMSPMIDAYKKEALNLAKQILKKGGRVALYEYRDLNDPFEARQLCSFSCSLSEFQEKLEAIEASGGGDTPESLLSAAVHAMKNLNWMFGANKSLIVLTDAPYLAPDRDGTKLEDVVELSLRIDPVNFYIITDNFLQYEYEELALLTGGKVFALEDMSFLTEYIVSRPVASLPYGVYAGRIGDLFSFDASASYGVGSEICYYEWDLDGDGIFESLGESVVSHSYNESGEVFVAVKVTDENGMSSTMSAKIMIADSDAELDLDSNLGLIAGAKLELVQDKNLKVSWDLEPSAAKYVLLSINENLMAYVLYDQGVLYIRDLDLSNEYKIGLALMDENFDFAEFIYLNWDKKEDVRAGTSKFIGEGSDWTSNSQINADRFNARNTVFSDKSSSRGSNKEEKCEICPVLVAILSSSLLVLWVMLSRPKKQKRLLFR